MTKRFASLLCALVVGVAGAACTATGSAGYSATATMPSMVYIGAGVQVVEDYDEPVFYSSNAYWRYDGGVWYQSHTYTGGWVRVSSPPAAVVRIEQPSMYVHYHASAHGGAQVNARPAAVQQNRQEEHREEKREAQQQRAEDKQERREDKQERREDKHDDKQDKGHKK